MVVMVVVEVLLLRGWTVTRHRILSQNNGIGGITNYFFARGIWNNKVLERAGKHGSTAFGGTA